MKNEGSQSAIHVSVRLPWHDRGWDRHACDKPKNNVYCGGLRSVNAQHIRSYRFLDDNGKCQSLESGRKVIDRPPCTATINVFGQEEIEHTHIPPAFLYSKGIVAIGYFFTKISTTEIFPDKAKVGPD